ncbi:YhfC family intramembrane metalloprotease [Vulcanisaeta moutnovskia]|nr:YhfC family intramembrane metalloprotease [Vulcanisaeta moutnovskia]
MAQLMTALLTIAYLIASSVIAYVMLNRFTWCGRASWVLMGIGFMVLALTLQVIAQEVPILIVVLIHIKEVLIGSASSIIDLVLDFVKSNIYLVAIYMGLMAGVFQEVFKYLAVRDRELKPALYIGYGFALVDIAFAIASVVMSLLIPVSVNLDIQYQYIAVAPIISLVGLAIQPVVSFLFHPGSSMLLRAYQFMNKGLRGLILMILAHAYMDSFVEYLDSAIVLGLINSSLVIFISTIYFITVIIIAILIFIGGFRALSILMGPKPHN